MAISVENREFFPTRVLNAPAEWVPLEVGIDTGVLRNDNEWGYQMVEKVLRYV